MICTKCEKEKINDDFNWKIKGVKRQGYCRECQKEYRESWYLKAENKASTKTRSKVNTANQRQRNREFVCKYLTEHPCVDCGIEDIRVLEFDHQRDKKHHVSDMVRKGFSITSIEEEIKKCEVVCANCHRIRSSDTFNYFRNSYQVQETVSIS